MSAPDLTAAQLQARAIASGRREAMRQRATRIRRAVASLSIALFATAFLIVYVQLASGHDPALVANAAKRRAASTSATSGASSAPESSTSTTSTGEAETESATATETATATEESSAGVSAVTSSQS
jgi:hypothetical protein